MKKEKFTIQDFQKRFSDDNMCLAYLFELCCKNFKTCPSCNKSFKYHRRAGKKDYVCQSCGHQISPTANTIFHKSSTSLKSWFYAIYLFSVSKNGVSAKELQRQLGVTYKTAWRMANKIRTLFDDKDIKQLEDIIEIDETYIGGKSHGKRGRGSENKTAIIGAVQRKGEIRAKVVSNTRSSSVKPFVRQNIKIDSQVMTDEYRAYTYLSQNGYYHNTVNHSAKEYARGNVHTNTIEGFWSQLKRSIEGTYHSVSPKYLQNYVNEFSHRYNLRNAITHLFHNLMLRVA